MHKIQHAGKELARGTSTPTEEHWQKLKRLGRYLIDKLRTRLRYEPQNNVIFIDARVETDLAGCKSTRKSTNGGALTLGRHRLKHWSTTQAVSAMSSGEAEFFGLVKGASALLGCMLLAEDFGLLMLGVSTPIALQRWPLSADADLAKETISIQIACGCRRESTQVIPHRIQMALTTMWEICSKSAWSR